MKTVLTIGYFKQRAFCYSSMIGRSRVTTYTSEVFDKRYYIIYRGTPGGQQYWVKLKTGLTMVSKKFFLGMLNGKIKEV